MDDSIDYTRRLAQRLADERERLERQDDPEYQASLTADRKGEAKLSTKEALAATLMKSAAQVGAVGGKTADASPVGELADRLSKTRARFSDSLSQENLARGKRREVDAKVLQYLSEKQQDAEDRKARGEAATAERDYRRRRDATADGYKDRALKIAERRAAGAASGTAKPPSDTHLQAAGFGKRAVAAAKIADDLIKAGYDPTTFAAQARNAVPGLNKWTMSAEDKQMDQAQRDFISAVLRKESGAAIPDTEIESERIKYFPQANDDAQTIANKATSRQRAIETLRAQAGHGWDRVTDVAETKAEYVPEDGDAVAGEGERDPAEMTDEELDAELLRLGGGQ